MERKDFPFEYQGGGYFRRKGVPKGEKAEMLHGEQVVDYIFNALRSPALAETREQTLETALDLAAWRLQLAADRQTTMQYIKMREFERWAAEARAALSSTAAPPGPDPDYVYAGGDIPRAAILCRNEEIDQLRAEVRRLSSAAAPSEEVFLSMCCSTNAHHLCTYDGCKCSCHKAEI